MSSEKQIFSKRHQLSTSAPSVTNVDQFYGETRLHRQNGRVGLHRSRFPCSRCRLRATKRKSVSRRGSIFEQLRRLKSNLGFALGTETRSVLSLLHAPVSFHFGYENLHPRASHHADETSRGTEIRITDARITREKWRKSYGIRNSLSSFTDQPG